MRYGLASEAKAIGKYETVFIVNVRRYGLWVNPKFPFLGCSPDGLVNNDTVVEIKSLKIFKEYSVESVTSATSVVPKHVLKRQCFVVKDGKCVLKRSHSYNYQCQQILLVTERDYCDFILYAESGPDSVERISRDEPLIAKILEYIQALGMRVIAPEIFEMRVPRELLPFILQESSSIVSSPESPESIPVQPVQPSTLGLDGMKGEGRKCPRNKMYIDGIRLLFKDVRANCFCASLLRTKFARHVIHRARALSSKVKSNTANGHCYDLTWI